MALFPSLQVVVFSLKMQLLVFVNVPSPCRSLCVVKKIMHSLHPLTVSNQFVPLVRAEKCVSFKVSFMFAD